MRLDVCTKYKVGDKVRVTIADEDYKQPFIVKDIIIHGSYTCLEIDYIVLDNKGLLLYVFEDELLPYKKK